MKAKTLILLGVLAALALMVVPALALSPLAATTSAPAMAASSLAPVAKPVVVSSQTEMAKPADPDGLARLDQATGGNLSVSINRATGTVRFIQVSPAQPDALSKLLGPAQGPRSQADAFWVEYGSVFGLQNPAAQLKYVGSKTDFTGATRLEYRQVHQGVPVFAGILFVHFNMQNQMTAVNGVSVPDITVASTPRLSADQAAEIAINAVGPTGMKAAKNTLYVYRTGLAQGVKGISHLAYEVEVTNGVNVRDFVIVDAQSGKIVDRWSAIESDLHREVYSGTYTTTARIWQEGDAFPFTGVFSTDINSIISTTGETYNLFASSFGRDSYDALGAWMRTVNNDPRINCPNANWNGITTNYCTGVTGDDTVAHEWGHAYTDYTHNLIYAWQPGALNESYSDIWGEVVDLLNGRGNDVPGGLRTDGLCSVFTSPAPVLQINSPAAIAGNYPAAASSFGPSLVTPTNWVTNTVVLVDDGEGRDGSVTPPVDGNDATTSDGCTSYVNAAAVAGKIALIDRGTCSFQTKADNANAAGAVGFIVVNHQAGGNGLVNMAGTGGTAVGIFTGYNTGLTIRSQLTNTVNATMKSTAGVADNSYRWLSGEDDPAFGEAIRDMWLPNCYNDPARVTDAYYQCDAGDGGGVHTNSGVPNHAFALLVDGGNFNGQAITGLGMTKAVHLYWRAQDVYQTPTTDFNDHADALLASCNDLVSAGTDLPLPTVFATTTVASGQVFTTTDCLQVQKVISAMEMRIDPTAQCGFQPLLDLSTPALCAAGTGTPVTVFTDTFEVASGWTVSHTDVYSATNLNWERRGSLPGGRAGSAFYGIDEVAGSQCSEDVGDVSRVMYLTSPVVNLPLTTTVSRLSFDHYVATETGFDGGNIQISVNGGPWQLIARSDYTFNQYNTTLTSVAGGNTNPLAGQPAFSGSDGGLVTGSWARSLVKISGYAHAGDSVQLRYQMGTDGCGGLDGWYVDDVQVYYCSADADAQIAVSPANLSSTQKQNTTVTKTLLITNTGTTTLTWELAESPLAKMQQTLPMFSAADLVTARKSNSAQSGSALPKPGVTDAPQADVVVDGGFEATVSFFNPYWDEFSDQFGSPICNASCGGPVLNGVWDVWLGGAGTGNPDPESGYVSQVITIPHGGGAELTFALGAFASPTATAQFSVSIDSTVLFSLTEATANTYLTPTFVTVNASQFADGQPHVLRFGEADAANDGNFNVFVDLVSVDTTPCYIGGNLPWLVTTPVSGTNPPGAVTPISVVFNAVGIDAGAYTGSLCIASDAVNTPVVNVPVSLTVQAYKVYLPLVMKQ